MKTANKETANKEIANKETANKETANMGTANTGTEKTGREKETMLRREFGKLNLEITEDQAKQFVQFYEDLTEKNQVMNLTAITEWNDVVIKHFIDSLSIVRLSKLPTISTNDRVEKPNSEKYIPKLRIIDLGTGAGFPGIPLKIMFPSIDLVLLDSVGKKISFLREEIEKLGFKNCTAVHARAEDLARKTEYREHFDLCVSRAVANFATLAEYCLPFVKKDGYFIAYKSGNVDEEIKESQKAVTMLSGKVERIEKFELETGKITEAPVSRTLIVVRKTEATPEQFPRKAGIPSRKPLKQQSSR